MNKTLPNRRGSLKRESTGDHECAADSLAATDHHLAKGGFVSCFVEPGQQVHLRISAGSVWATMEGDPSDHLLASGEWLDVAVPGHLLVEALSDAHVSLEQNCFTLNPS